MPQLHFLIGPTGVGKTELALRWAERHGGELLYCDAFCVYRGMDIGTAKPTAQERARVPHHGVDLVQVEHPYSIADYVEEARRVVEDCASRGRPVLVTGGSGFYARSFFHPVTDESDVTPEVRDEVRQLAQQGGPEALRYALLERNPDGVDGIDLQNPRRVQTALERCVATGLSLAEIQARYRSQPPPFPDFEKRLFVLDRPREVLHERIARRSTRMLQDGLIDEVRRLRGEGLEHNPTAAAAIGYRETLAWLDARQRGEPVTEAQLVEEISANTRRLVKKQQSFFRNQLPGPVLLQAEGRSVEDLLDAME